jgi:type VI secretion system protein ImpI
MSVALVARVVDTQANQSFEATYERFPVRIGRNQLNDMHIDRPYVSQFHAAIDVRDGRVYVRDLGSTNGTGYQGQRLARDASIDITALPEITIGPIKLAFQVHTAAAPKPREQPREGTVLDFNDTGAHSTFSQRKPIPPGAEDPYLRQLAPYIEAYRAAWGTVYRVIYDHLMRLPPDLRTNYIKRLGSENASVNAEPDFQKIAQYYGVDSRLLGEIGPAQAALAALGELAQTLAPGAKPLDDVASVLSFARHLRDALDVFLKCFISLRDGHKEFEAEVIGRDRGAQSDRVALAKDAKELGVVLLDPPPNVDAARQLHEIFVDVMSHQVAMITGVMEGVKSLLVKLSPRALEDEYERGGKKGGLFSSKYEELWRLYERHHNDYSSEDKGTFLVIFGPQFSRAYDARQAEEDYKRAAEAPSPVRYTLHGGPGHGPPGRPR